MTEIAYPTFPDAPEIPPVVAQWHNLRREFYTLPNLGDLLPFPDRENDIPDVRSIGDLDTVERYGRNWQTGERWVEYQATNAERVARYAELAQELQLEISRRVQMASDLAAYTEQHRAELEEYQAAERAWNAEKERLLAEYYAARDAEIKNDCRARFTIGYRVRPFRARNYWEIIARNGNGAIIRECRYDDKPARIREIADVLGI